MITIKQGEKVLPIIFLDAKAVHHYYSWWEDDAFKQFLSLDAKIKFEELHPGVSGTLTITCNLIQKEEIEIDLLSGYYIATIETKDRTFNEKVHII